MQINLFSIDVHSSDLPECPKVLKCPKIGNFNGIVLNVLKFREKF